MTPGDLVAEEVIPLFGVPECLLSDRGTNLLSNLMMELCKILGIKKLNTTAYHPQCDGAVEWHGPYRILDKSDPNVTCIKVYYPQDGPVHVHQSRISRCPEEFPAGFYWYGNKRRGPGRPPKWVDRLLRSGPTDTFRKSVTTSRHGAQHAAIGDSPQRQDDLLQQSQHQDGCAPQVHSSPEDTPGTAQEDQPFRECTYSEDPGPGEVTLLSETEWTTDDEDTEDPAASGLMDETMEQKRTTDSGAGQDLGDIHEGTLGAGSRTTANTGVKIGLTSNRVL